jgi:hypothetical protein
VKGQEGTAGTWKKAGKMLKLMGLLGICARPPVVYKPILPSASRSNFVKESAILKGFCTSKARFYF